MSELLELIATIAGDDFPECPFDCGEERECNAINQFKRESDFSST